MWKNVQTIYLFELDSCAICDNTAHTKMSFFSKHKFKVIKVKQLQRIYDSPSPPDKSG